MRYILTLLVCLFPIASHAQYWGEVQGGFEYTVWDLAESSDGTVWAVTTGAIYRSTDQGNSWETVKEISSGNQVIIRGGDVYAATWDGLLRSTDGGSSWENLMPANAQSVWVSGSKIAAGGTGGQLYWSTDGGDSWTVPSWPQMPKGYDGWVEPVIFTSKNHLWGHSLDGFFVGSGGPSDFQLNDSSTPSYFGLDGSGRFLQDSGGDVYRSDQGYSWSQWVSTPMLGISDFAFDGDRMAAGGLWGLTISGNGGSSWSDKTSSLNEEEVNAVLIDSDGHAYVATDAYIHRSADPISTDQTSTSVAGAKKIPGATTLHQAYPNPFNPVVTIPFSVAEPGKVRITIVDELGREAAVIIDRSFGAGTYRARWEAGQHPSGTYLIQMKKGATQETRQVTLAK